MAPPPAAPQAETPAARPRIRPVESPAERQRLLAGIAARQRQIQDSLARARNRQLTEAEKSAVDRIQAFVAQTEATTGTPLTPAGYIPAIAATLGVPASTANFIGTVVYPLAAYPSPSVALGAIGTDVVFACNARLSSRLLSQYVPTYQYEFNDPNAPMLFFLPSSFPTGAYHASELQYIFTISETPVPSPGLTPAQEQLSGTMVEYWTQFARSGDPNSLGAPAWPLYGSSDEFLSLHPPTPATSTGLAADHKCAFWGLN